MKFVSSNNSLAKTRRLAGLTLIEMLVAIAIGGIILTLISILWMFGLKSFASMTNYVDLDNKSRRTLDLMTQEMREASQVLDFQKTSTRKWLLLTNADDGATLKYTWDQSARTLVFEKTGCPTQTYLTECDSFEFDLFQRTPQTNTASLFYPATNTAGATDVTICKLVDMSWKCSRKILGSKVNTESVLTAQVVLRNKQ